MKKSAGFRLTPEVIGLLLKLAELLGITQAAALEIAIRDLAKKRGVR